jgi:hypothetical protein
VSPLGQEFQINTYTTEKQRYPCVAVDAAGNFIAVWESFDQDGSNWSIQGQRYASDGSPVGGEFQINTYTTNQQRNATVGADATGAFVVTWRSDGSYGADTDGLSIQGQRYDSDGSAIGAQFEVNSYTTGSQAHPRVAVEADGDFVVVWDSLGSSGGDTDVHSIQGQRFDSGGSAAGPQFQVNTVTTGIQWYSGVDIDADGDFVVVWDSDTGDGDGKSVRGQRFGSDGVAQGGEFQVNSYTTNDQTFPALGVAAGGSFVVAWDSRLQDGSGYGIFGQRYASDGSPSGDEFQINTYTIDEQFMPAVGLDGSGGFVVTWHSAQSDGDPDANSIQGQKFDSDGTEVGAQFQVNSYTTGAQTYPALGVAADGSFVVAWQSDGQDGDTLGIFGQRYARDKIFIDGFESGNTSQWSATVP